MFNSSTNAIDIAKTIELLIDEKQLNYGDKLPSIRTLAKLLGVSPSTTASSYARLERTGAITSSGRNGTKVTKSEIRHPRARVFQMSPNQVDTRALDLSTGFPDPLLLPNPSNALSSLLLETSDHKFLNRSVCDELREPLEKLFQDPSRHLTVVNGSLDAIDRTLALYCQPKDKVIVEEPNFPAILDLIDAHKLIPIPVEMDEFGIDPDSTRKALQQKPQAIIIQPRAQNPSGASITHQRLLDIAGVLEKHPETLIIEDDHSGLVCLQERITLGNYFPDRTITIFGFSKSHGPDLRISAVIGPKELISKLDARRRLGPSWTSELLQRILAYFLVDPTSIKTVDFARTEYQRRLHDFINATKQAGIHINSTDGLNAWVPTSSNTGLITELARNSIVVAPGNAFYLDSAHMGFVRITTASLDQLPEQLLDSLSHWS